MTRPGRPILQALPTRTHLHVGRGTQPARSSGSHQAGLVNNQPPKTNPSVTCLNFLEREARAGSLAGTKVTCPHGTKGPLGRSWQEGEPGRPGSGSSCTHHGESQQGREADMGRRHTRYFHALMSTKPAFPSSDYSPQSENKADSTGSSQLCSTLPTLRQGSDHQCERGHDHHPTHTKPPHKHLRGSLEEQKPIWGNYTGFLPTCRELPRMLSS